MAARKEYAMQKVPRGIGPGERKGKRPEKKKSERVLKKK